MSIRECASNSDAFRKLKNAFDSRESCARKWKENGTKVVLTAGSDIPEEVLIAAGVKTVPLSWCFDGIPTPVADKYLEGRVIKNRPLMSMFEKIVNGYYASLADKLLISNSDGTSYGLFNVLRELDRNLDTASIPELYFLDVIIHDGKAYKERNVRVISRFIEFVEDWTGKKITKEDLFDAIKVCNKDRSAMAGFDALRKGALAKVTGSEALVVIASSLFMDKKEHAQLVEQLIGEAASWPVVSGNRLFITGSDHQTLDIYEQIEDQGFVIVGEDHNRGARLYQGFTAEDVSPVEAIAARMTDRPRHSTRALVSRRVEDLRDQTTECSARYFLCYLFQNDTWACWDYPEEKKALENNGISCGFIQNQALPSGNHEELIEVLQSIKNGKH